MQWKAVWAKIGVTELADIKALVAAAGYDDGRVVIDPSVVRGLEYYTGPVFEVELTFSSRQQRRLAALRLGRRRRTI